MNMREHDIDMLTLGQYLAPSEYHMPVKRYVTPQEFIEFGQYAKSLGFTHVASGPLVRSSYHADLQARGSNGHPCINTRLHYDKTTKIAVDDCRVTFSANLLRPNIQKKHHEWYS